MLASSGERMPPCGVPVSVSRLRPSSVRIPALQERLHQRQDALVPDPSPHPAHQGRVVDLVEARLDVALEHPLVGAGREVVDLGDRVLGPALRAEAVGARLEVRLEDRLEHQLQGRLHDPVRAVGMPSRRSLPPALGIIRSRTGSGAKPPGLQIISQPVEERLDRRARLDVAGATAVDPGRSCALVAPHPIPRHHEERRVSRRG